MKRRGAAIFVLLLGGLLIGRLVFRSPVEVDVSFHLGAAARDLAALEVRYLKQGDEMRRVTFRYPRGGAPEEQLHHTKLPIGGYVVAARLSYTGSTVTRERTLAIDRGGGRAFVDLEK